VLAFLLKRTEPRYAGEYQATKSEFEETPANDLLCEALEGSVFGLQIWGFDFFGPGYEYE
jgi:hypothetical protein